MRGMYAQIRAAGKLLGLDCGDNSCMFAEKRGGMRTNGGCRCDLAEAITRDAARQRALLDGMRALRDMHAIFDKGDWTEVSARFENAFDSSAEHVAAYLAAGGKLENE